MVDSLDQDLLSLDRLVPNRRVLLLKVQIHPTKAQLGLIDVKIIRSIGGATKTTMYSFLPKTKTYNFQR